MAKKIVIIGLARSFLLQALNELEVDVLVDAEAEIMDDVIRNIDLRERQYIQSPRPQETHRHDAANGFEAANYIPSRRNAFHERMNARSSHKYRRSTKTRQIHFGGR